MAKFDTFDPEELLALARAALERNEFESALEKLKHLMEGANPPADAIALSARLYAQLGLYARAEKLYQRYLKTNPKAITEQFQLGLAQVGAGRPAEALQVWDGLLKEEPNHIPTLYYRALVLAQTGKAGEAKAILDHILKWIPVENPYFNAAKQLLNAILATVGVAQSAAPPPSVTPSGNGPAKTPPRPVPPDPYRTEGQ